MSHTESADTKNETASNRIATGAVIACTSAPVSAGPTTPAMDSVRVILLLPSKMFSAPISDGK